MLVSSVPTMWRQSARDGIETVSNGYYDEFSRINKDVSKNIYIHLRRESDKTPISNKAETWSTLLDCCIPTPLFCQTINRVYTTTNVAKLRSFQYRLMHYAIILNTHLYRWKMREDNLCSFCHNIKETIDHLLLSCPKVQELWASVDLLVQTTFNQSALVLTHRAVLLNEQNTKVNSTVVLIVKQYIYRQRCQGKPINNHEIKFIIWQHENLERYVATKNNKLHLHCAKWNR